MSLEYLQASLRDIYKHSQFLVKSPSPYQGRYLLRIKNTALNLDTMEVRRAC